ncbi:DUF7010 family protein [Erythrobacter sp. W53]|uniref:DUF7010 family protein n=1 Tax=Erythrobacter sp. W53 TaxID=3425947 RepID=UPI003D76968A
MTQPRDKSLRELQREFQLAGNNSMPIAGLICWSALGVAALFISERAAGTGALYIMLGVLPLAWALERARGRNLFSGADHPMTKLFLQSIAGLVFFIPIAVIAANVSGDATLVVLGMAVAVGLIWIPFGWAADDPVGLRRGIGQAIGCYAAYLFAPDAWKGSAICAVVVLGYVYVLSAGKKLGETE